ncbi:c-type cytochrome [Sagittula sp. NFXS13]|uniref:Cytochrome c n=1 Tax=Sagittula marina TaxID=943940 RepID=A0A7W6DXL7_9RHOB|nr:c-type cytochrome [Sagittula marina]MBB3988033.1 cytochrome c [Sagittula marina]
MKPIFLAIALTSASTIAMAESHATGDPAAGEKVFNQCKTCHVIEDADGNAIQKGGKVGPNLYGVVGRTAGSVEGFRYSKYMVAAGEQGLAWDEDHFAVYVKDASAFLKDYLDDKSARGKMTYRLRDDQDALDVWAYLASVGPEPDMTDADAPSN